MKTIVLLTTALGLAGCAETRPATTVAPDSYAYGAGQVSPVGATSMQAEPRREREPPKVKTSAQQAVTEDAATDTGLNERDRGGATLTPMDQGGGDDRRVTADVRKAVVADGALSFTAKNVKIITVDGKVTLRGPVRSAAERASIEEKARAVIGVRAIDNQLEIDAK